MQHYRVESGISLIFSKDGIAGTGRDLWWWREQKKNFRAKEVLWFGSRHSQHCRTSMSVNLLVTGRANCAEVLLLKLFPPGARSDGHTISLRQLGINTFDGQNWRLG